MECGTEIYPSGPPIKFVVLNRQEDRSIILYYLYIYYI